ncbi:hypothetical protein RM844_13275 [Streptomyces sp. DSM 44915]|uniref:Uncharacterized protein n=1 Tax=Streptomyces chisholmiae TaxID=3075540 RepID=A0ABU2JQI8_9ACTN|nr:hypothetical protein [Streptomyces sp. DSM 44915]MDT0267257.1 hypothetical protein [Streptomyces sp. DSM 44915]
MAPDDVAISHGVTPGCDTIEARQGSRRSGHTGVGMRVRMRVVAGEDGARELASLRRWLAAEAGLRGAVDVERRPVGTGEMGALADTLTVALGAGGAVTVLAGSLSGWLRQRRSDVRIDITASDGRHVSVTAQRVRDAPALIETVLAAERESRGQEIRGGDAAQGGSD